MSVLTIDTGVVDWGVRLAISKSRDDCQLLRGDPVFQEVWSSGASTNFLWPGQAFFLWNPNSSKITITFAGLIRVGGGPSPIAGGIPLTSGVQVPISSIVPQPGGLTSALGYSPNHGDHVYLWNQSTGTYDYYTNSTSGWSPREPALVSGQGFVIIPAASQTWNRVWLPYCDSLW